MAQRLQATVGGRTLSLSNLDKVLYPEAGFTKAEVIDYIQHNARAQIFTAAAQRAPGGGGVH